MHRVLNLFRPRMCGNHMLLVVLLVQNDRASNKAKDSSKKSHDR